MNKTTTSPEIVPVPQVKEKIIFDIQPMLMPTILNIENLISIGFAVIALLVIAFFHLGLAEIIGIIVLFLIFIVPSMRGIFLAGSTNYVLTTRRLMIFTVSLGQKERSLPLSEIDSVKVHYSGLQRFYGAGDIYVKQKGLHSKVRLFGLKDVKKRADQIQKAMKQVEK